MEVIVSINGDDVFFQFCESGKLVFSYENLNKLIDSIVDLPIDEQIGVKEDETLPGEGKEKADLYVSLLNDVIRECRKEDFLNAVKNAKDSAEKFLSFQKVE